MTTFIPCPNCVGDIMSDGSVFHLPSCPRKGQLFGFVKERGDDKLLEAIERLQKTIDEFHMIQGRLVRITIPKE